MRNNQPKLDGTMYRDLSNGNYYTGNYFSRSLCLWAFCNFSKNLILILARFLIFNLLLLDLSKSLKLFGLMRVISYTLSHMFVSKAGNVTCKTYTSQTVRVAVYNAEIVHFLALCSLESKQLFNNFYARTYARETYFFRSPARLTTFQRTPQPGHQMFPLSGQRPHTPSAHLCFLAIP